MAIRSQPGAFLVRHLLQRRYAFDRWHVGHANETYVADIARFLNAWPEARRDAVLEIGCGLGDILRRLRFRTRVGLDRESEVVGAARFLARWRLGTLPRFDVFDFPRDSLTGTYDAIILVNWIHEIETAALVPALRAYATRHLREGGAIILDTVDDPAYRFNHDIRALASPGARIELIGSYPRGRRVWAFHPSP